MWNGFATVKPNSIIEKIKTLKEAESYSGAIDETVESSFISDNVTGKLVKYFKKP